MIDAPAETRPVPLRGPGPPAARLAKYGAVLSMSVTNNLAYAGEVLLRGLFLILLVFVFIQLWDTMYGVLGVPTVGGFTVAQMVWYFAFAEAIVLSAPRLANRIDQEVKSGDVAYRLNKPYNYVLYLAADYTGERLVRFVINLAIGTGLCLLLVGPIGFAAAGIPATLVLVAGAWALDFLVTAGLGLLAFWVEDTYAFILIYSRLLLLLGGTLLPIQVFPGWLRPVAEWLPFGYMVYGPARSWVAFDPAFFADMLLRQGVTFVLLGGVVALIYRAGTRRLNLNGG